MPWRICNSAFHLVGTGTIGWRTILIGTRYGILRSLKKKRLRFIIATQKCFDGLMKTRKEAYSSTWSLKSKTGLVEWNNFSFLSVWKKTLSTFSNAMERRSRNFRASGYLKLPAKLPLTSRAFCCADSPCYFSPELLLSKDRKLMVYSKARLCSFSWDCSWIAICRSGYVLKPA